MGGIVAEEFARRTQCRQLYTLLQGVLQLLDAGRHLVLGAPVRDSDMPAEPPGGAGGVHRGVAAADHHHLLAPANRQRRLMVFAMALHQVHPGEELVGAHHVEQMLTGHVHEPRQAGSRADEDVCEPGVLQFGEGGGLADHEIGDERATQRLDLAHHVVDQRIRQPELRDAITQHTAQLVESLEDRHRMAFGGQQESIDQPGRPRPHHGDRWLGGHLPRVGHAGVLGGVAIGVDQPLTLRQEPFQLADLDWPAGVRTDRLALQFLRTDASGHVGQRVDRLDQIHRLTEMTSAQQRHHVRDRHLHRAATLGFVAAGQQFTQLAGLVSALFVAQRLQPDQQVDLPLGVAEGQVT